jgi:hypothetical protein
MFGVSRLTSTKSPSVVDIPAVAEEDHPPSSTLDITQPVLAHAATCAIYSSNETFADSVNPPHNWPAILTGPTIHYAGKSQVDSTLISASKNSTVAAHDIGQGGETFDSDYRRRETTPPPAPQSYSAPAITPTWTGKDLDHINIDRPQLERWVYETSNSEITTADRLEKSNWEADCSSRL